MYVGESPFFFLCAPSMVKRHLQLWFISSLCFFQQPKNVDIVKLIFFSTVFKINYSEDNKCCSNLLSLQFCSYFQEHCGLQSSVMLLWWTWLSVYRDTNKTSNYHRPMPIALMEILDGKEECYEVESNFEHLLDSGVLLRGKVAVSDSLFPLPP